MGRIRGVYGKPWSKLAGDIPLTRELMDRLGQVILDSVIKEAKKDLAKQGRSPTPKGQPEGLPATDNFFESFSFKVVGKSTVTIISDWDWIEQHLEGRKPYPMTWLTRAAGVNKVPMVQKDGTVLVRCTPLTKAGAWIHPGFARHTFLERGIKKAREKMADIVMAEVMEMLAQGDPTR